MTDQKDADRGFDEFHPFVIKLTVPRPKWTTNAGQRECNMLTPKLQFHMNLISQDLNQAIIDLITRPLRGGNLNKMEPYTIDQFLKSHLGYRYPFISVSHSFQICIVIIDE